MARRASAGESGWNGSGWSSRWPGTVRRPERQSSSTPTATRASGRGPAARPGRGASGRTGRGRSRRRRSPMASRLLRRTEIEAGFLKRGSDASQLRGSRSRATRSAKSKRSWSSSTLTAWVAGYCFGRTGAAGASTQKRTLARSGALPDRILGAALTVDPRSARCTAGRAGRRTSPRPRVREPDRPSRRVPTRTSRAPTAARRERRGVPCTGRDDYPPTWVTKAADGLAERSPLWSPWRATQS